MVCAELDLYTLSWCWYKYPEVGNSSIDWAQLSTFYLKTETESSLRNVFLNINRAMGNVQKHNIYICVVIVILYNKCSFVYRIYI
jgi:hypothetical protein